MAKKKISAEELVAEASGLSAEELVSGRARFEKAVPKKKKAKKKVKPLTRKEFRKEILRISRKKPKRLPTRKLPPPTTKETQKVLSKEQTLLNNMFGGSVGRLVLLDRPGQFFDGSGFPVARPQDSRTAAMFGGRGYETRKFFLPTKSRRPTI